MLNSQPNTPAPFFPPRLRGIGIFPGMPRLEAAFVAAVLAVLLMEIGLFVHFSRNLRRFTDARLLEGDGSGGPAVILASPAQVYVGMKATPASLASRLRDGLYAEGDTGSAVGTLKLAGDGLDIHPGPASFFRHGEIRQGPVRLRFRNGRIMSIQPLDGKAALQSYWLEPEVMTTLSGYARSEQHLVRFRDMPKVLVDAVIATEDHRFFSHHGVNPVRMVEAAIADLRGNGPLQGGSTLTMQLARNLFLTPRRTFDRKVEEVCLAEFLEMRLSKKQIFELYANRVYLGQHVNFGIFGLGDAAEAYFHKDVGKLSLPEAAFLAGLIRGPNLYSPYKYHERALERRDFVLSQMMETGAISPAEGRRAMGVPLNVSKPTLPEGRQEAYFEDMVMAQLRTQFTGRELHFNGLKVYTTLDPDLQRAASEGARSASAELDQHVKKNPGSKKTVPADSNQPQFALVALDPHTGEVKALIGRRDYGASQLNHALARRQPGSAFKLFVYAPALSSGVDGSKPLITPATLLNDQPTEFKFGLNEGKSYAPRDYGEAYHGTVTVRQALRDSLNVPAVSLAQMAGFNKVRKLAIAAGFNSQLEATPSIALGAYEATPMEVAGSYTIFANQGQYISPRYIREVDDASGAVVWSAPVTARPVLDPRVSYLMVSLLASVIDNGTGYDVRARGFRLPAAGKTGTSHDGWFAGFTSNLLAVAWVGYDDDRQLNLTGAQSALPFWTEFMKQATDLPSYRNAGPFTPPPGIVTVPVEIPEDPEDSLAPLTIQNEIFIQGTQPSSLDESSGGGMTPQETTSEASANGEPPQEGQGPEQPVTVLPISQHPMEALQIERTPPTDPPIENSRWGRLRIQTDPPGLEVFIDGKPVGPSPLRLWVPVGEHTYKVYPPPGGAPAEHTVRITTAAIAMVNVNY